MRGKSLTYLGGLDKLNEKERSFMICVILCLLNVLLKSCRASTCVATIDQCNAKIPIESISKNAVDVVIHGMTKKLVMAMIVAMKALAMRD